MEIRQLDLLEGARDATGLTVIIDVFRAFSLACYTFGQGAQQIIPVGDIEEAYKLKKNNPEFILVGERMEKRPEGFDFGNSPMQVLNQELAGKTIVHTTSSGTQGLVNAVQADEVITGSFVNVGAIIEYIKRKRPETVSLVGMGYATQYKVEEDDFCGDYIANALRGKNNDFLEMTRIIRETSGARFFIDENQHFAPREDFDLCLQLNKFNFVLKRYTKNGRLVLNKIDL